VEKARGMVMQNRLLAEHLGVGKEAARQILERDFQKRKLV
jgi:hypothetical protein